MNNRINKTISVENVSRKYIVHVPKKYDSTNPAPLVVMLHGTGGDGEKFWNISGWKEKAEKEGFIAVFPSALRYCYIEEGVQKRKSKWMTEKIDSILCTGEVAKDDVLFMNSMLDQIIQDYSINEDRIYFSGFSNGGGFVRSKVFTEMSDRVAAVSTMGGLSPKVFQIQGEIIPIYTMHGEIDDRITVHLNNQPLPLNETDLLANTGFKALVDSMLVTTQLNDTYKIRERDKHMTLSYTNSLSGNDNEWRMSIVRGLLHRYPNGKNNPAEAVAADIFWDFFKEISK